MMIAALPQLRGRRTSQRLPELHTLRPALSPGGSSELNINGEVPDGE